jgi:hypothetical protein
MPKRWGLLTLLFVGLLVACAAWIAMGVWGRSADYIRFQWLAVEATLLFLCALAGLFVSNRVDGIFIDEQNRISLGRVQWVAWFIVLLGGFFTESTWNIAANWNDATQGSFPGMQAELYALLGIVSGSAITGSIIVDSKKNATNAPPPPLNPRIGTPTQKGLIDCNVDPSEASWADLYLGEEVANRNVVDVSRLQKLVVTILLIMAYVQLMWTHLGADLTDAQGKLLANAHFGSMPQVGQSFLWLLGISHAAYLAYKATPKTPSG